MQNSNDFRIDYQCSFTRVISVSFSPLADAYKLIGVVCRSPNYEKFSARCVDVALIFK